MFDFQKEVVINSAAGIEKVGESVRIDGMLYKKEYMGKVFVTEPKPGEAAVITIKVADLKTACGEMEHAQILVELGLDKDYRGDFGTAMFYFKKPVLIDVAEISAENLKKAFELAIPKEYKYLAVSSTTDSVVLTAADSYITVRNIVVTKFAEGVDEVVDASAAITVKENVVEFGTYNYLIQNLRLPTYANVRFMSPAVAEMPVFGGEYVQYSFIYCVPRHIGGVSVAGQVNHSSTTHTFYVLKGEANDKMKSVLATDMEVDPSDAVVDEQAIAPGVVAQVGGPAAEDYKTYKSADSKTEEVSE